MPKVTEHHPAPAPVQAILEAAFRGDLTREQALELHDLGPEAVALFSLAVALFSLAVALFSLAVALFSLAVTGRLAELRPSSIFRTLKLRGHDPTTTVAAALRELIQTGTLPPLPGKAVAGG
jgi:hypothetical protein